jgi:hypothetical protein
MVGIFELHVFRKRSVRNLDVASEDRCGLPAHRDNHAICTHIVVYGATKATHFLAAHAVAGTCFVL